eukprot:TRINITY_DN636_c0_g1_i3.p1 TRINITY_DN636_c0_g1~~TRINITY_DN636_c0_g1_i3.p1  ORF type:complete len:611 (-),score=257.02 TRINITY_DN636_c0_g1_i3:590-2422(-)
MEISDATKLNGQMAFANKVASNLVTANEATWMRMGNLAESMHDPDKAIFSYENVLRHNPYNVKALTQIASICRLREQYPKAVDYFQRILNYESTNGEIWGALGHCYLMMDDLQKAYSAYQQALYHLPNPKDPNLWYGIGILYDRYGSFEHAEEAFTAVLKMDPKFEKSSEIHFRLGIIYKQQVKYEEALNRFRFILAKPPRPLTQADIYFQIGHVHELQKDFGNAKEAYERVLKETPNHAKSLQQLGWLYHSNPTIGNQEVAINYLLRSLDADPSDGQTWYLLGRCYMAQSQYRKAYDAYQQAVYRDGRNPTFWCSIGVLYYQINQYRDALDAYSRAIRLNPYLSEVWYDLGTLYESCNQISDSLDAYERAAKLDPGNKHIQQRLSALREADANGTAHKEGEKKNLNADGKTPMTMEPRAAHHHVGNEANLNRMGDNSQAPQMVVADLVDLSEDNLKGRNLPHLPKVRENKDQPVPLSPSPTSRQRDDRKDQMQPLQMRPFKEEPSESDGSVERDSSAKKSPSASFDNVSPSTKRKNSTGEEEPKSNDTLPPVKEESEYQAPQNTLKSIMNSDSPPSLVSEKARESAEEDKDQPKEETQEKKGNDSMVFN